MAKMMTSVVLSPLQSPRPITHLSSWRKTRISLIRCRLGQDTESDIRLSLDKWIKKNDEIVRLAPVFLGASSFLLVLLNRTLSGIAPVADASSAQSRADVVALAMAATVVLTGLVWISVKPKKLVAVGRAKRNQLLTTG